MKPIPTVCENLEIVLERARVIKGEGEDSSIVSENATEIIVLTVFCLKTLNKIKPYERNRK